MWERIIEDTGDPIWGDIALEAFALDVDLETFKIDRSEIHPADWEIVKAVRAERSRREVQRAHQQREQAKRRE